MLNQDEDIAKIIDDYDIHISFITKIELLSIPNLSKFEKNNISELIQKNCTVHNINDNFINEAIKIKLEYRLKIPDSIIAATAKILNYPLLSADIEFKKLEKITKIDIYSKSNIE